MNLYIATKNPKNIIGENQNKPNSKVNNRIKISLIKSEKKPLCILIGPEGDFSESERLKILNFKDVETIKLNDNILRSETAAISALSVINFIIN